MRVRVTPRCRVPEERLVRWPVDLKHLIVSVEGLAAIVARLTWHYFLGRICLGQKNIFKQDV